MRQALTEQNSDDSDTLYARKSGPMDPEMREDARETFLAELKKSDNVTQACAKAGINRDTAYYWREQDTDFAQAWQQAKEEFNDTVRSAIFQRGVEGWEEPVVSMGKPVFIGEDEQGKPKLLTVRKYSDSLLLALAKSRMPEFREKQTIDLKAQFSQMAEQAKEGLLADLASAIANEDQESSDQQPPDA